MYQNSTTRPQARNTQPLTPEQISKLRQDSNAFDTKVEVEDLFHATCTHNKKRNQPALITNEDGSYTCTICHETFKMYDIDSKDIEGAIDELINAVQSRDEKLEFPQLKPFPSLKELNKMCLEIKICKIIIAIENFISKITHFLRRDKGGLKK